MKIILLYLFFATELYSHDVNYIFQRVRDNDIQEVTDLLDKKENLSMTDKWGANALFEARSAEMVDLLISRGKVNPNQKRISGTNEDTPLHIAVISSNVPPSVVKKLIDRGANPLQVDVFGKTPIDYAQALSSEFKKVQSYREKLLILLKKP